MKSRGTVRRIDGTGRITLTSEDRKMLGIKEQDEIEMIRIGKKIEIHKFIQCCEICEEKIKKGECIEIDRKLICQECVAKIEQIVK